MNTSFRNITFETLMLFNIYTTYKKWWEFKKRKNIKKQIYEIELPIIRDQLNQINDFDSLLLNREYSRIYVTNVISLIKGKCRLTKPNDLKSKIANHKFKSLYNKLINEKTSYSSLERSVRNLKNQDKAYFENITGASLDVFVCFEEYESERKKKNK